MKKNMKRSLLFLFVFAFSFSGNTFAQFGTAAAKKTDLTTVIPLDKKVITGKLDNGLTYFIRENKQPEGRAEFQLALKAGSILEEEDQVGLAHFTEHMAFNGTKYFPGNEMTNTLEKKGMTFGREINAYTGFDQTVYTLTLTQTTPDYLDLGFKVLDGWASGLLMDGKEIDQERGVILEEWRGHLGASERLRVATWPVVLKDSRYLNRLPIGTEENLRKFKHESIRKFYNEWYRPDLMAVILVGDFNGKEMEKRVKEIFGAIPKRENPKERVYYNIPDNVDPLVVIATDKEATRTSFMCFWKHDKKEINTLGDFRRYLTAVLFNGMINSRLAELAEKTDCPYTSAYTGYGEFYSPMGNIFFISSNPKDNLSAEKSFKTTITELSRIRQHGFLETEIERQKESILSGFEKAANEESKANSSKFAQEYVAYFINGMPSPGAKAEYKYAKDLIEDISAEEINSKINEWVTKENFVFELTGQENKTEKMPTEKEIVNIFNSYFTMHTEPWVDNFVEEPLVPEELSPAAILKKTVNETIGFTEITLSNGVKVVMLPTDYKNDQILMTAQSPGGNSIYSDDKIIAATLAASIIDESGLGSFSNSQLSKKLKGKIVSCTPSINDISEGISGSSTPKDVETLLELTYLFFKAPRKDPETFERITSKLKTQIKLMHADPKTTFIKKFIETSYPESKRVVTPKFPTIEDINKITLEEIYNIYTDRFADASDFTFFFVGNFEVDTLLPLVQKYLGSLPSTNRKENWINHPAPFAKGIHNEIVEKGVDKQGLLIISKEIPYVWDENDNIKIEVLNSALDITVREIIREKIGGTYSPSVKISTEKLPESKISLVIFITCDPDNAKKIEKETLKIINNYIKKGTDKVTLAKVQEQLIAKYKKNYAQENGFWLTHLYMHYVLGTKLPNIAEYEKAVQSVTIDDTKEMAVKYLKLNNYVSVILKPEKTK